MKNRIAKSLLGAMMGVAVSLAAVAPAQAAVVTGSWDPYFGGTEPTLSGLFWTGTSVADAPGACINAAAGTYSGAPCTGMKIISAAVNLTDFYLVNENLNFTWTSDALSNINISGLPYPNQVAWLETLSLSNVTPGAGALAGFSFQLAFDQFGAHLYAWGGDCGFESYCLSDAPDVVYKTPEPGTLGLAIAGLLGFGATYRRRQQRM